MFRPFCAHPRRNLCGCSVASERASQHFPENPDHCLELVEYAAVRTSLKRKDQSAEKLGPYIDGLTAAASLPRPASKTTPILVARFMDGNAGADKEGRRNIQLGVARCPSDTFQVVFCGHDEGLITDGHALEKDLCQVARTNPAKGVIWPPDDESWSVSGDCRFFAIGIGGDGSFAVSAGLCEALKNWYRDSVNGTVPEDVDAAVKDLIRNDGTGLNARGGPLSLTAAHPNGSTPNVSDSSCRCRRESAKTNRMSACLSYWR